MSKRVTTRWYLGAWLAALVVGAGARILLGGPDAGRSTTALGIVGLVLIALGIVMFVMWIGALIKLAQLHAWGWFAFVLLLYVLTLGILGIVAMVVYALAGPSDTEVVMRPTAT